MKTIEQTTKLSIAKKFIFLLLLATTTLTTFAQTESEHLTFKGIPIDGTLDEFVSKMKDAGFSHVETTGKVAGFNGDFAGDSNCSIISLALESTNTVYAVMVMFPESDSWVSLENKYINLKSMLIKKYGKPTNCEEKSQVPMEYLDNKMKLNHLKTGRCTFITKFEILKGIITLAISDLDSFGSCVSLTYKDKINGQIATMNAMEDL